MTKFKEEDALACAHCGEPSGHSIICDFCRKHMHVSTRRKYMNMWHEVIRGKGYRENGFQCFYCKKIFCENEICGDHIYPRRARPDLMFDVRNGWPTCMRCNQSDIKRKMIHENDIELPQL